MTTYRKSPFVKTLEDIEAPYAHMTSEEQTGVPTDHIQNALFEDIGGGYVKGFKYQDHCQELRFYQSVCRVMEKRKKAFAGLEIVEICGPPEHHKRQLLRNQIRAAQSQLHRLWKTLTLRKNYVAVDKLTEAHEALTDVDAQLRKEQSALTNE